jgi:hypothetical protein
MHTQDTSFGFAAIHDLYPDVGWFHGDKIEPSSFWGVGADLSDDGWCNARGSSARLIRTCVFGADSADCGHQSLTLPRSKIPDSEPDNSCTTANNGLCEDQLFFSEIAPNDVKLHEFGVCLPNTE